MEAPISFWYGIMPSQELTLTLINSSGFVCKHANTENPILRYSPEGTGRTNSDLDNSIDQLSVQVEE